MLYDEKVRPMHPMHTHDRLSISRAHGQLAARTPAQILAASKSKSHKRKRRAGQKVTDYRHNDDNYHRTELPPKIWTTRTVRGTHLSPDPYSMQEPNPLSVKKKKVIYNGGGASGGKKTKRKRTRRKRHNHDASQNT